MIPRTIHFIWIHAGSSPSEQNLFSIKTAVLNTTCKVVLHTDDPSIQDIPGVEIRRRSFPKEFNGIAWSNEDKIEGYGKRVSHVSDIIRLEILHAEGGIYSDMDVIWLRNPYEFWDKKVVIGFTNKGYKILANAILMSVPGHPALLKYRDWLLEIWPPKKYWIPANPYKLWKDDPDVMMVDKHLFFPIKWSDKKGVELPDASRSVCIHTFASMGERSGSLFTLLEADYKRFTPA